MFTAWMNFAFDSARLYQEAHEVMTLRWMKLAAGGPASHIEAQRMIAEKGFALAEAAGSLASGASVDRVVRRYRAEACGHITRSWPCVMRKSPSSL